ncbi:hypothetical protein L6R49_01730 [Myxococcota bacterium]|nr:hypothetical protein [Myxococcota bacterium]
MVRALGYSASPFDPSSPGRLCRGRERWIPGWDPEGPVSLYRLVLSGAEFSDDSARDARRGLACAQVEPGVLLQGLFPGRRLWAFREEGYEGEIPDYVPDDDDAWFRAPRRGGAFHDVCRRWRAFIDDPAELSRLVNEDLIDGLIVLPAGVEPTKALDDAVFLLTSQGDGSAFPVKRFQPMAMLDVLQHTEALVTVHFDKHGAALGIYTRELFCPDSVISQVAEEVDALAVPFAIPPMLARWDRALQELRARWSTYHDEPFPVPSAAEPTRWSRRRGWSSEGEEEEDEDVLRLLEEESTGWPDGEATDAEEPEDDDDSDSEDEDDDDSDSEAEDDDDSELDEDDDSELDEDDDSDLDDEQDDDDDSNLDDEDGDDSDDGDDDEDEDGEEEEDDDESEG